MRCLATTQDGDQCQNPARKGLYHCGKHRYLAEPPQCMKRTQDGDQCQNPARKGSDYCGRHQ